MVESDLETRVALLERRVRELESVRSPAPAPRRAPQPAPVPERRAAWRDPEPEAPARVAPRRDAPQLEDLLGGRVLAWVGALAVLVGLVLLLVIAISNGWIGEGARTLMAGAASLGLLAAGVRRHERRGRTEASLAAAAAGIAGLFATCVVAGAVDALVPAPVARAGARAPPPPPPPPAPPPPKSPPPRRSFFVIWAVANRRLGPTSSATISTTLRRLPSRSS